jgi:uncharacterized membrane protein YebE (DUF533 family)
MSVSVDQDFARFGAKSYAINKINSVEVRDREPHGKFGAYLFGAVAAFVLLGWFGAMAGPDGVTLSPLIVAAIFAGLAYWQWQRSKIREYHLFLMTSSSETQAFVTRDSDEVMSLRDQIEAAMLHHSRARTDR